MRTIKDKELHEKYCNICIDSPNSLFASLDESSKSIIRQTSICKMYRKGDLIYEEGNKPFGLICLITGKAKIAKKGIAGREQIVRMAKPVGFIGYRAFFAEEMHIASAEALEESIVCIMKTELIFGIVRSNSDVAMNVIRALATDLGFSNRRTVTLTQKHIRGRLAEALLVLKDTYGFEDDNMTLKICLSREDMANLSNMTTSNAIRTLSNFASEGILELSGKQIKITNMEALEKALETEKNVKFIYTIPNFQNPSGITMSLEKRHRLYELAKAHDVMILEDNPYGDLYYEGEPLPSIKSFDTDGIVIYAGSFSKVISPGMRVGYAIGPKPVLAKMTVCKQGQDVHTNIWSQVLCYRFMTEYDFDAHLAGLRKIYTKKRALLLDLMEKHLAPYITWDPFNGGLFAWCHLPKGVDMMEFVQKALEKKVCVVPGTAFLTDENEPCDAFRINFSTPTDEQLTKGITLLGETIREMVEK